MTHEVGYCLAVGLGFLFGVIITAVVIAEANARNEAEWEDIDNDEYWY